MNFETPFGAYSLKRFPDFAKDSLQAWDAADELLLNHLAEHCFSSQKPFSQKPSSQQSPQSFLPQGLGATEGKRILLVNDQFGGLAVPLNGAEVTCWSDSFLSHCGTRQNFQRNAIAINTTISNTTSNDITAKEPKYLPSTAIPEGKFDVIVMKIPKVMALLEYQLFHVARVATPDTYIVAGGMVKGIHTSTLKLFECYLGETTTSLAKKKARLILPRLDGPIASKLPQQKHFCVDYLLEPWGYRMSQQANLFSREKLDIGARFFIEQFPKLPTATHIVDLGCGNGVLSMVVHTLQPDARLTLIDESYMAVDSAKGNLTVEFGEIEAAFVVADGLSEGLEIPADLILCNPPFHQGQAVSDRVAKRMFRQSYSQLTPGGELWVVANRHLKYRPVLARLFDSVERVAENRKFVVLKAVKSA